MGARMQVGRSLAELGLWALRGARVPDLMDLAVCDVARALSVELACVLELSADGKALVLRSGVGWPDGAVGEVIAEPASEPHANHALLPAEPAILGDLSNETRFFPPRLLRDCGVVSGITVPLVPGDMPAATLSALSVRRRTFSQDDVAFMHATANMLALAILRESAEGALRGREHEFVTLVETSPDVVCRFDRGLRYMYANASAERLRGLPLDAMLGRTDRKLGLPEPFVSRWELLLRGALATGREQTFEPESAFPTRMGERWYRVQLVPEFAMGGSVNSVLVMCRDVSDLKRAQQERSHLYDELIACQRREQDLLEQLLFAQRDDNRRLKRAALLPSLTEREREILRLVAQGCTNREIGAALRLSPGTVKNHVSRLLPKLGAVDRTQAAAEASDLGLTSQAA